MKKIIAFLICAIVIALVIFVNWFFENQKKLSEIQAYNNEYKMYFCDENGKMIKISGIDLNTLMNKAIDNNERIGLEKKENGAYIPNKESSMEIWIQVEPKGDKFLMEAFEILDMSEFRRIYGELEFECKEIKYHKNGKISKLIFGIVE